MERVLEALKSYFAAVTSQFSGIEAAIAKVTAAEEQSKVLRSELDQVKQTVAALTGDLEKEKAAHSDTKTALEKAQGEVNTAGTKIKDLEKAVETEKNKANQVIASQGLPADQLPTATVSSTPAAADTAPGLAKNLKGMNRLIAHFSKK